MEVIFKEYSRVSNILNSATISHQKKQLVDTSRWKRKFKTLFDQQKCICFDLIEAANTFTKSGLVTQLELKPKSEAGEWVLQQSPKFWVLFTNYVSPKIAACIDSREKLRRQIVEAFFEVDNTHAQTFLKKHLDNMLYLPEISSNQLKQGFMRATIADRLAEVQ